MLFLSIAYVSCYGLYGRDLSFSGQKKKVLYLCKTKNNSAPRIAKGANVWVRTQVKVSLRIEPQPEQYFIRCVLCTPIPSNSEQGVGIEI